MAKDMNGESVFSINTDRWQPRVVGLGAAEGRVWVERDSEPEHVLVGVEPSFKGIAPAHVGDDGDIHVGQMGPCGPRNVSIGARVTGITVGGTMSVNIPSLRPWQVRRFFLPTLYESIFAVSRLQCVSSNAITAINGTAIAAVTGAQLNAVFGDAFGIKGPFCNMAPKDGKGLGCVVPAQVPFQVELIHYGGGAAAAANVEAEIGMEGLYVDGVAEHQCAQLAYAFGGFRGLAVAVAGTAQYSMASNRRVRILEVVKPPISARNFSVTRLQCREGDTSNTSGPTIGAGGTIGQAGIPGEAFVPFGVCARILSGCELDAAIPITVNEINNSGAASSTATAWRGEVV